MSDQLQPSPGSTAATAWHILDAIEEIFWETTVERRQVPIRQESKRILDEDHPLREEWINFEKNDLRHQFLRIWADAGAAIGQYWITASTQVAGFIVAKKHSKETLESTEEYKEYKKRGMLWNSEQPEPVTEEDVLNSPLGEERTNLLAKFALDQEFIDRDLMYPIEAKCEHYKNEKWWEIERLGVSPRLQRKGIGKVLVNAIKNRAYDDKLPLYVCSELTAVEFYEKQGFKRLPISSSPEKDKLHGVHMAWPPDRTPPASSRQMGDAIESSDARGYLHSFQYSVGSK
ncbi:hypothetical protein F5Y18DRAFT_431691 [Xylariaceae sp. FL1019]|nr:hypothetical protein F5Y18DRAFT_431691 [Xylariaceae sp. FL1019]